MLWRAGCLESKGTDSLSFQFLGGESPMSHIGERLQPDSLSIDYRPSFSLNDSQKQEHILGERIVR